MTTQPEDYTRQLLIFTQAQGKAAELDSTLTGDQLDRIGNLAVESVTKLTSLTDLRVKHLIRKVK